MRLLSLEAVGSHRWSMDVYISRYTGFPGIQPVLKFSLPSIATVDQSMAKCKRGGGHRRTTGGPSTVHQLDFPGAPVVSSVSQYGEIILPPTLLETRKKNKLEKRIFFSLGMDFGEKVAIFTKIP